MRFQFYRAGDAIDSAAGIQLLSAPPISILMDHGLVETSAVTSDGANKKTSYINQSLFSLSCSVNDDGIILFPFDVGVKLDSPTAFPERTSECLLTFKTSIEETQSNGEANGRPAKRSKHETAPGEPRLVTVTEGAGLLANLLSGLLDEDTEEADGPLP